MALLDNQSSSQYYTDAGLYGEYQFVSLADIITQFMFIYVVKIKLYQKPVEQM